MKETKTEKAARATPGLWSDDGKGHRGRCTPAKRCPVLRLALKSDARGRGLETAFAMQGGNISTVIVYRKSARDGGCVVNFCPFCGGDMRPEDVSKVVGGRPELERIAAPKTVRAKR